MLDLTDTLLYTADKVKDNWHTKAGHRMPGGSIAVLPRSCIILRNVRCVKPSNLMLFIYPKSEQEDLTAQQLRILRQIVEEEYP
jgi:hypothetical protein